MAQARHASTAPGLTVISLPLKCVRTVNNHGLVMHNVIIINIIYEHLISLWRICLPIVYCCSDTVDSNWSLLFWSNAQLLLFAFEEYIICAAYTLLHVFKPHTMVDHGRGLTSCSSHHGRTHVAFAIMVFIDHISLVLSKQLLLFTFRNDH